MECIICFEEKEHIFFRCGHGVCVDCIHKVNICPLCRITIRENEHTIEIPETMRVHEVVPSVILIDSRDNSVQIFASYENRLWATVVFIFAAFCFIGAFLVFHVHP